MSKFGNKFPLYDLEKMAILSPTKSEPSECIFVDVPILSDILDKFLFTNNNFSSDLSVYIFLQNRHYFGMVLSALFWSERSACAALGCRQKRRWPL